MPGLFLNYKTFQYNYLQHVLSFLLKNYSNNTQARVGTKSYEIPFFINKEFDVKPHIIKICLVFCILQLIYLIIFKPHFHVIVLLLFTAQLKSVGFLKMSLIVCFSYNICPTFYKINLFKYIFTIYLLWTISLLAETGEKIYTVFAHSLTVAKNFQSASLIAKCQIFRSARACVAFK